MRIYKIDELVLGKDYFAEDTSGESFTIFVGINATGDKLAAVYSKEGEVVPFEKVFLVTDQWLQKHRLKEL